MLASEWWWLVVGAAVGAALAAGGALLLLAWLERPAPPPPAPPAPHPVKCTVPQAILNELTRSAGGTAEGAMNAALQFIFQQSTADTRWLRRRMAAELAELLAKAPSGRLFESLTLRSLDVGTEFPSVTGLRLVSGELEEDGARLRALDLTLDLAYDGSFRIDVDAVMLLGKIANISITVESVCGPVRLLFRRTPYTHWAMAFESPPQLQLGVRGRFQGRQLKPRLASLIAAHIRRAVAQRHTMPNYKIRYKPFFPKSEPGGAGGEEGPTPGGCLVVHLMEVTRMQCASAVGAVTGNVQVRAVVAVDSHAWVSLQHDVLTLDVTVVPPAGGGQLGLVCCQTLGAHVAVDTVVPMSPAYRADLRRGDIVLAIDSKPVATVGQVGKLLRNAELRAVTLRVRRVMPRRGKSMPDRQHLDPAAAGPELKRAKSNSFSFRRVSEVMEGVRMQGMKVAHGKSSVQEQESVIQKFVETQIESEASKRTSESAKSLQKPQEPVAPVVGPGGSFGLRKRRCSVENKHSSDSSAGSTPPASGSSTPLRTSKDTSNKHTFKHGEIPMIRTDSGENHNYYDKLDPKAYEDIVASDESSPPDDSHTGESSGHSRHSDHIEICQIHHTKMIPLKPIVIFDEKAEFKLNENHKYLNINMWATIPGENEETLLGYLNIPLASLLLECQDSTIGHHMKRYQFLPPDVDIKFSKSHPLSSHAGFEPCLCFGDALVWWSWETSGESPPRTAGAPPPRAPPAARAPRTARAQHDFVRTHFHRSTQCDFCSKKIWLKDAMQCRSCGLCCHKKCVAKCQESSPCSPPGDAADAAEGRAGGGCSPSGEAEGEGAAHDDSDDEPRRKDSLDVHDEGAGGGGGGVCSLMAGLRRAGSAHALSAPRPTAAQARSLPPSPCHTPRKQSLEAVSGGGGGGGAAPNPFSGCGAAWRTSGGDVACVIEPAVRSPLSPDALLAAARDSAPELAAILSKDEIHKMMAVARDAMAAHVDEGSLSSESKKARALTALMLHCCAAAQLAQAAAAAAALGREHASSSTTLSAAASPDTSITTDK